jgi:hypothetical protein
VLDLHCTALLVAMGILRVVMMVAAVVLSRIRRPKG